MENPLKAGENQTPLPPPAIGTQTSYDILTQQKPSMMQQSVLAFLDLTVPLYVKQLYCLYNESFVTFKSLT